MWWAQAASGSVSLAQPSFAAGCRRLWRWHSFCLVPIFPGRMQRRAPKLPRGLVIRPDPPAVRPGIER